MDYLLCGMLTLIGTGGYLAYQILIMRIDALETALHQPLGVSSLRIDALEAALRRPRAVPNHQIMIGDTESGFKIG